MIKNINQSQQMKSSILFPIKMNIFPLALHELNTNIFVSFVTFLTLIAKLPSSQLRSSLNSFGLQ